ncbi:MAG: hypothetical protein KatS3mg113_0123 [Planctomycetaceae bacterium]|nr:MAG: hypothetical protein KatS3mg113_0123 [Planctomycetaceae bacterium]
MAIRVVCEHCGEVLNVSERKAGGTIRCPACRGELLVPSAPAPVPTSEVLTSESPEVESDAEEARFTLPKRAPADDEMDLTPMVDVVFQLLIFFMVTASFSLQKSISMPTPDQQKKGASQALQMPEDWQDVAVMVRIDDKNVVTVDDEVVADLSDLADRMRDLMRREQKSETIIIADGAALHRTVVSVIDAANAAGMQRIRLGSAPPPD